MRIISGVARGTRLRSLQIRALRPMLDRVKEALFNILRDVVPGADVLDLFSGCGALGLEALSRGARGCVFVEQDARLVNLAAENAQKCKLADRCRFLEADVLELPRREVAGDGLPADLVFVDPPYALVDDPNRRAELVGTLESLVATWMREGAAMCLHHRRMPHLIWPTCALREVDKRVYGQSQLTFFEVSPGGGHE